MKLGLGNLLVNAPVNSVPLGERPTLGISFDRSRYTNPQGFANQAAVGSADFKLQSYAGPSPTFTRATMGTFRGSNGLIQYAPENLLLHSEDFSQSQWVKTNVSFSYNTQDTLDPSGGNFADKQKPAATNGTHPVYQGMTLVQGLTYTFSCYAKAAEFKWLALLMSGSATKLCYFNLETGEKGSTATGTTSSISKLSSGWYRCTMTWAVDASIVNVMPLAVPSNNTPYSWDNSSGNGTDGIYIWGAQLERHSSARPYISTTSQPRYGPRFEYDTNGEPLGLLMEEQSQNLLSYSEQFDNAAWATTGIKAFGSGSTANAATSPNGTITADLITPNTTLSTHGIWQAAATVASGVSCTATWYVKPNGYTKIAIVENQLTGYYTAYDASASGSVLSQSNATGAITALADGWYRITHTSVSGGTLFRPQLFILSPTYTGGSVINSWAANGTSGIYIWGAQLEQKPFATSYIPTVAGAVTRSADTLSMPVGTWYNTDVGTIVFEGDRITTATNNAQGYDSFFSFYSNLAAYNVLSHLGASDYEQFEAALDGFTSSAYTYVGSEIAPNTPIKFALTYDSPTSTFYAAVNGFAPATISGVDPLEVPDTLRFGNIEGNSVLFGPLAASYFNGHIKSFSYTAKYWPDDIQALTA